MSCTWVEVVHGLGWVGLEWILLANLGIGSVWQSIFTVAHRKKIETY